MGLTAAQSAAYAGLVKRLSCLLLSCLLACSPDHSSPKAESLWLVATSEGELPLDPAGILPRISRSESVTLPLLGPHGVTLRRQGGPQRPRVSVVVHEVAERVLRVGSALRIVGPPVLPLDARGAGDLPHLARLDGALARGETTLSRGAAAPTQLVLIGGAEPTKITVATRSFELPPGPCAGVITEVQGAQVTFDGTVDQAFFARVREANPKPVTVREGEQGELFIEPPQVQENESWTLVFDDLPPTDVRHREGEKRSGAALLVDVAQEVGLDFVHFEGPDEQLDIRPTMGPGVAWGDVDGDGYVDLYLVQGGGRSPSVVPGDRLYHNDGRGGFRDVTQAAGLGGEDGAGMGALLADLDGDGDLDLYVANYGVDRLYANDGQGVFHDVTDESGIEPIGLWSAGISAADIEGDGDLDLYVTSYLDYDPAKMPEAPEMGRYRREDPVEMLPFAFPGERNRLLLNEGGLHFRDVTEAYGLADAQGRGMQSIFWDFDADGDPDLYIANDVSYNTLFRNDGQGHFTDVSFATGLDDPRGGMGLAVGDTDRDGDEDLLLTNWQLESNALYENLLLAPFEARHRRATFHDSTVRAGLGGAGIGVTSWGAVLFDLEADGDLDLLVANGYTSPDYRSTGICVGQPNHLFLKQEDGKFHRVEGLAALERRLPSRAAAACDYDRDGDLDILITANNAPVELLRNDAPRQGHWLGITLRGEGGNRHAIGAEVTVHAGDLLLVRSLRSGTSYLACEPAELLFGLGEAERVQVEVRWPWGKTTTHGIEQVDRWIELP